MGIKFTADNFSTDFNVGGGLNATNWSKTFPDYWQGSALHHYAHGSGSLGYTATQHLPFYYQFEVSPRTDPGSGSYDSDGANRYYPVSFQNGSVRRGSAMPNLVIYRGYNLSGPSQFQSNTGVNIGWTGSSTHQGGLYASYHVGDSAWSDMFESQLTRHRMTYHTTISSHGMRLSYALDRGSGPFFLMLRGGFTYWVNASYPAMPTQVTAGGSVFTYGSNTSYQTWPASTTSVADSNYNGNLTSMG
tara:strand:- start:686 stop:1423 length:738 start_codon:yes stop_codon:yes gene_type:complete